MRPSMLRGFVTGSSRRFRQGDALVDRAPDLRGPLLRPLRQRDQFPAPSRWTSWRRAPGGRQTYEFHRYDGAGHAFFAWTAGYRPEAAVDGWQRISSGTAATGGG